MTSATIRVYPDGRIVGLTQDAERIIHILCLNSPLQVRWRRSWIRIVELAAEREPELYRELMGYPEDLPNLQRLRVPENARPNGIKDSCYARRERGELPDTYLS